MNEELYKHIAAEYLRQSGAELRGELNELSKVPQLTPALDKRVNSRINALRRGRYARITGIAAACLAVMLLIPSVLYFYQNAGAPAGPEPGVITEPSAPVYEILPLSFVVPDQFSVASVEQDVEKTVYYFENSELDNVVMTLERAGDTALFGELTPVSINGYDAYGSSGSGYCLLAFEKQDILYVLSCKNDINTLVKLSKSILV